MKHLKITFTDGTEENLESKYARCRVVDGVLMTENEQAYDMRGIAGPSYPLVNIRKYEWVEGYK